MKKTISNEKYLQLIQWLKQARLDRNLTMRELGTRLGVPHSFIGKIETAERRLDIAEYVIYCQALQIDPEQGLKLLT